MIETVDALMDARTADLTRQIVALKQTIGAAKIAADTEDSKSREKSIREAIVTHKRELRLLESQAENIRTETFKDVLAEKYDFPRDHPKFNKVYDFVYSNFHGNGWNDIDTISTTSPK